MAAPGWKGLLARATIAAAHARLAERGVWALNEKGILPRAGLHEAEPILAAVGQTREHLEDSVVRMRELLGLERPRDMQFVAVVRGGETSGTTPRT